MEVYTITVPSQSFESWGNQLPDAIVNAGKMIIDPNYRAKTWRGYTLKFLSELDKKSMEIAFQAAYDNGLISYADLSRLGDIEVYRAWTHEYISAILANYGIRNREQRDYNDD